MTAGYSLGTNWSVHANDVGYAYRDPVAATVRFTAGPGVQHSCANLDNWDPAC